MATSVNENQATESTVHQVELTPMIGYLPRTTEAKPKQLLQYFLLFLIVLIVLSSYTVWGFLFYQTLHIYSKVVTHTIIATVRNYQLTLNIVGLVAGSTAFLLQIHSQVRNKFLCIKMSVVDVAKRLHEAKIEEIQKNRQKREAATPGNPHHMTEAAAAGTHPHVPEAAPVSTHPNVPELIRWSPNGLPCIPKDLYRIVINHTFPEGVQRFKVLVKLLLMAAFVVYIARVMTIFHVDESEDVFHTSEALMTLFVCILPSVFANLQSDKETELQKMQNIFKIEALIKEFLKGRPEFYNYKTFTG